MAYDRFFKELEKGENSYDIERIKEAYALAERAHKGQKRKSGEEYVSHPLEVARLLIRLGLDTDCIVAALLHDTIEDTEITDSVIKKQFGKEVLELVEGVTKLGEIPYVSKEEAQIENLRKMFMATAKDIRVIIIKLADRLHNMRTLDSMPETKRRDISLETLEVFAPIAHRLGMQRWKVELEDIGIRYLDPIGCGEIERAMEEQEASRDSFIKKVLGFINERFKDSYFEVHVEGRVKNLYSTYRKMYGQNKTFDEIYDLYALRIIVDNMNECYNALGIIHDVFKPIPGRFKDYISTPKPNMYQSLHTTVIGKDGIPFEVQIRTWDMHKTAEYGIAAHWKYKQNISDSQKWDKNLEWVGKLVDVQSEAADPEEFLRSFKVDFFAGEVFVFTPKGDLVNLPAGSTVIDFAYTIHSAVGNRMTGAKVNGKMVTLDYIVKNGEIVEIITGSQNKGPNRDWLNIARTSEAKNKIKQWFKKERRPENIEKGKADIEDELKKEGIELSEKQRKEVLRSIAKRLGVTGEEELYATLGYGGIAISRVMSRLKDEYAKINKLSPAPRVVPESKESRERRNSKGVIVEGVDNVLIKFARCCNPLPGDDIIGYITKGYGISIHRTDCINVKNSIERGDENDRWLRVLWSGNHDINFTSSLKILGGKRVGLLADVTMVLANLRVFIHAINAREVADEKLLISIVIDAKDVTHIESVMNRLGGVRDVISVKREGEI